VTTLLLIRHASTASTGARLGGRTDTPLSEEGRAQARDLAQRVAEAPLKAVYASPLPRAMETARVVAEPHGLDVRECPGVIEADYGAWTDRPLAQLARTKRWRVVQGQPSLVAFPEGETIRAMQARAADAVEALVAEHPRDAVAVVSHADVIKAVVAFYVGQPLDCFQRLQVAPASVTVLALEQGGVPALVRLNDDGPLSADRFRRPRGQRKGQR
jgi:probable phosphomutase (TIGR03848 family)